MASHSLSLRALGSLLLVAAACGGGGTGSASESDPADATPPVDAEDVPESVEDVVLAPLGEDDDQAARLDDLLGEKPIVLNFFASWCQPCIEEMPVFETVHRDLGDEVTFLGLAMMDGEDRAVDIVETTGVTYPTYADPDGSALTFFEGTQMPTTVFLSPEGETLDVHSRALTENQLRDEIAEHFEAT